MNAKRKHISFVCNTFICIFVLIISGIEFTGCTLHGNKPRSTIIKGNIRFPQAGKIYFYSYADTAGLYLGKKSPLDSSVVDKNGNYSFSLNCKTPCVFDLKCGDAILVTNLFIKEGDEIKLNFAGKNNQPEIFPASREARQNTFLLMFLDTFYREPAAGQVYYIGTNYMDIGRFVSYNESRRQKQLDLFNSFFKNDSVEKEFNAYVLSTINYGIAVDRLMYLWKKRMKGEGVRADSSYFSFETPAFIENREALNCPAYIRFLNLYIKDEYERMVERGELPHSNTEKLIPQVEKYKLALNLLKKPYRDVVVYNIILGDMNDVTEENNLHRTSVPTLDSLSAWFKRKYSIQ
jgi:hypothetical protein